MIRVKVADGWTVFVPARGGQVPAGSIVEVDAETAAHWIQRGWAEPVVKPKR